MDYAEFASGLPPARTMVSSSVEELEDSLRRVGVDQQTRQLTNGEFRSAVAASSVDDAELFSDRYNRGLSLVLEPPKGMVGLLFPRSANGHFVVSGQNVPDKGLILFPAGSAADIVTSDLCGSEAIAIPESRFAETIEVLCRPPRPTRREHAAVLRGDIVQRRALQEAVLRLVAHPGSDPNDEIGSNVVAAAVAFVGHASPSWRQEKLFVNGARRRVAKRAQDEIEAQHRGPVRLEDLCRATGVGFRTLQRCFREYFDLTISDYLKMVRLDAAHRGLVAAERSQDSVTEIALRNGMTHLGRFSIEYRHRFGHSPNETLTRVSRGTRVTHSG